MRSHVLCLLVVLAALVSTMRVGAKPSFTMPDGDDEEEDVAVAADPVEIDEQVLKSPVTEPPLIETDEKAEEEVEQEAEETPGRRSSKGTISLLFSKGSWFKSFFRPKPPLANPKEDEDNEDEETELKPTSSAAKSSIVDGVSVGSDDVADDESQRGRRHLPKYWSSKALTPAPNKGRQPLAMPPNKGSAVGSAPSPSQPPNRRYASSGSKPPVDGLTAKPNVSWRPARKTYAPRKQWYRHYQPPSYYSRRQWYVPVKYSEPKKSSPSTSTAFPNRIGVPNRGNYPNSAWQYSPYNYISKEPPRKQTSSRKGDGY